MTMVDCPQVLVAWQLGTDCCVFGGLLVRVEVAIGVKAGDWVVPWRVGDSGDAVFGGCRGWRRLRWLLRELVVLDE